MRRNREDAKKIKGSRRTKKGEAVAKKLGKRDEMHKMEVMALRMRTTD